MKPTKRCIRFFLRCGLHVLAAVRRNKDGAASGTPRRILILNGAHAGDIIISTCVLPVLKSAFPGVEIGFVVGSWAAPVLRRQPDIAHVHLLDHWKPNRSQKSFAEKWKQYRSTRRQCLRELREAQYDWAICLHPFYPDLELLAWQAGIPVRAGFAEAPYAPLATHRAHYDGNKRLLTQGQCQGELLQALGIEEKHLRLRKSSLPVSTAEAEKEVRGLLGCISDEVLPDYVVLHMGAGAIVREWPTEFWRELAERLSPQIAIVCTGLSEREKRRAEVVLAGLKNGYNACGRLSWDGYVAALRYAREVYTVETSAMHVAAAVDTPCQAVTAGIAHIACWRPEGSRVLMWTNHVPCAPCMREAGCATMACRAGIAPQDLVANSYALAEKSAPTK